MSDCTPEQWAEFCAREVMGAKCKNGMMFHPVSHTWKELGYEWSPYENPADALEVLERLVAMATAEQEGPEPPSWTISRYKWGGRWENSVTLGAEKAHSPGPHFGPAVCELARKVMEGR